MSSRLRTCLLIVAGGCQMHADGPVALLLDEIYWHSGPNRARMEFLRTTPVLRCPAYEPKSIEGEYSHLFRHIRYKRTPSLRPMVTLAMLLCRRMARCR